MNGDIVAPARVRRSWLARVPFANQSFRMLAPLYPSAFARFDFSRFDTIVSSTTAWAKGIRVPTGAVHVCYINTVSRFLFAYDRYVGGFGVRQLARPLAAALARWDLAAARRPTAYIANSQNVAARVKQYYGRDAYVLPCPVDVERFSVGNGGGGYFFVASRLLPYKRIDLAIAAAQLAGVPLLVAGTGPAERALRQVAKGTTTRMLGFIHDDDLAAYMANARAVIVPGEEDFGLVPLEAAAAGRPAIAYRAGGALETVIEGETGTFFAHQDAQSLAAVLRTFDEDTFSSVRLRSHAEGFAPQRFIERLRAIVNEVRAAQ